MWKVKHFQTARETDGQTAREIDGQTARETDGQTARDRRTDCPRDRQTNMQIDRVDRWMEGRTYEPAEMEGWSERDMYCPSKTTCDLLSSGPVFTGLKGSILVSRNQTRN